MDHWLFALIETLIAPTNATSDDVTSDTIETAVLSHLRQRRILHYERHVLHSMVQDTDSVTSYVQRLKDQANRCDNGDLRNELIFSQFVLSSSSVRSKLLASHELTLDGDVQEALLNESVSTATSSSKAAISTINSQTFAQRRSGLTSTTSDGASVSRTFFCYSKPHRRKDCKFR